MRDLFHCSAILLALSAAAPAVYAETLPVREAEIDLAGYADCVVRRSAYRKPVAAFLRAVPGSAGYYDASMKAADMTCLNDAAMRRRASKLEMRLQPDTFRDALYPALYRQGFGKEGPPAAVATVAPVAQSTEFDGDIADLPAEYEPRRALGDCVSRAAPRETHALLIAKPYSKAEDVAVAALRPAIGGCVNTGTTLKLNRAALRAATGEAMYKLATAAGGGG